MEANTVNTSKSVTFNLRIHTPVHIGSGNEIIPNEYFYDDGKFNRVNINSLVADPEFKQYMDDYIEGSVRQRQIEKHVPVELLKRHILYSIDVKGEAASYIASNPTTVKEFIKTSGKVYIPGSSVKGSILSGLIYTCILDKYGNNEQTLSIINNIQHNSDTYRIALQRRDRRKKKQSLRNLSKLNSEILDLVFDQQCEQTVYNRHDRFIQWINVSDSNPFDPSEVLEIRLAKVVGSRGPNKIPILYETLKENVSLKIQITRVNLESDLEDMIADCGDFYYAVADYCNIELPEDGAFLRLGQGSSVYATSLLTLFKDLKAENKIDRYIYMISDPKTSKLIDGRIPMGWIEVTE